MIGSIPVDVLLPALTIPAVQAFKYKQELAPKVQPTCALMPTGGKAFHVQKLEPRYVIAQNILATGVIQVDAQLPALTAPVDQDFKHKQEPAPMAQLTCALM